MDVANLCSMKIDTACSLDHHHGNFVGLLLIRICIDALPAKIHAKKTCNTLPVQHRFN